MAGLLFADQFSGNSPWGYVLTNPDPKQDKFQYRGHFENLRLVLDLLRNECQVYWIEATDEDQRIRRGDYLIPMRQPRARLAQIILATANKSQRVKLTSAFACQAYPLRFPRIQIDAHRWAGNYYWYYDTLLRGGFSFEHLYQHQENSFDARRHNLYVVPGGGGRIPAEYNELLRKYVAAGGNYLGSCWGCAQALYPSKVSYGSGNGAGIADARNNEITRSFGALGGVGHVVLKNDAPDHPIMWDIPNEIHNIYWNGPVMEPGKHSRGLASLVRVVEDDFRFHARDAKQRRVDVEEEIGKCLYLTSQRPNEGRVTVFGNHPEASDGVNPFRAHVMGYKATYNAILFSTAGPKETLQLEAPNSSTVLPKLELKPTTDRNEEYEICRSVRTKADKLIAQLEQKRQSVTFELTEDMRSGFFLLRLLDAAHNLQQCSLQRPAAEIDEGLRKRFQHWSDRVEKDIDELTKQLQKIKVTEWNRQATRWHAVAGPIFERSIELSHLDRDLLYQRAANAANTNN